jgi:hypothetical protein
MLKFLENSKLLSVVVLLGTLFLLTMVVFEPSSPLPNPAELKRHSNPPDTTALVGKIEALFSEATLAAMRPATNLANPFYTTYFQPPLAPPKPVTLTPPAPTTKKVQLTYQGDSQSSDGIKRAFIKVGDGLFFGPVGSNVVADFVVSEIALHTLTLKNAGSQTNILQFNVPKEVEVPIK